MTNPVRPPNQAASELTPAALAATALANEQGQPSHAEMAAAAIAKRAAMARPGEPMRTSAPGFSPVGDSGPSPNHAPPVARVNHHPAPGITGGAAPHAPAPASGPSSKQKVDPYVGSTFDGRYQIEKRLGEGGMGVVYAAKHTMIGKRVAVKVLRNEYASDKDILDRFVQEARTASSIGNPHIVDISDFGVLPDGATYFVMELLEGIALTDVILPPGAKETARVDPVRICKIALQLCDGLGAAHAREIVHRDLKPDNIFLVKKVEPDFVKILDFGIAKVTNTATQKTRAGQVFGTPHYMSPEQASGRGVDARSDIYSVGVILYEMATGSLPFTDETYMGILTAHMYRSPEPIRSHQGLENFPLGLDAIIQKCLAKSLELRYQSMGQLDADLRRALGNEEPEAVTSLLTSTSASEISGASSSGTSARTANVQVAAPKRTGSIVIIVAGVLAAVGLVAGALFLKQKLDAEAAPPPAASSVAPASTPSTSEAPAKPSADATAPASATTPAPSASAASKTHVLLRVTPPTAQLLVDGKPLAKPELDVDPAAPTSVRIEAPGYLPQTVQVDGKMPELAVTLARPDQPVQPPTAVPTIVTSRPAPSSRIEDPWTRPGTSASSTRR